MGLGPTLAALAPFVMVVAIVALAVWSVNNNRRMIQDTVREAIRSGQTLDPETIKALGVKPKSDGNGDLRAGAILIAIAISIAFLGGSIAYIADGGEVKESIPVVLSIASFPGLVGAVLLFFGLTKKKDKPDEVEG